MVAMSTILQRISCAALQEIVGTDAASGTLFVCKRHGGQLDHSTQALGGATGEPSSDSSLKGTRLE